MCFLPQQNLVYRKHANVPGMLLALTVAPPITINLAPTMPKTNNCRGFQHQSQKKENVRVVHQAHPASVLKSFPERVMWLQTRRQEPDTQKCIRKETETTYVGIRSNQTNKKKPAVRSRYEYVMPKRTGYGIARKKRTKQEIPAINTTNTHTRGNILYNQREAHDSSRFLVTRNIPWLIPYRREGAHTYQVPRYILVYRRHSSTAAARN